VFQHQDRAQIWVRSTVFTYYFANEISHASALLSFTESRLTDTVVTVSLVCIVHIVVIVSSNRKHKQAFRSWYGAAALSVNLIKEN
jgi:hypothetical protein